MEMLLILLSDGVVVNNIKIYIMVCGICIPQAFLFCSALPLSASARQEIHVACVLNNEENVWPGPGDISPVGVAANLHIDMSITNLGIQEYTPVIEALMEVFPGCPEIDRGYAYLSDRPGLGVDINLKEAAK